MEKCIIDLFSSITQIDSKYYKAIGTRHDGTTYPQVIENSFTAELYHRFKTIMEQGINIDYYNNLVLHFDIGKYAGEIRPDLVLHEAQENRNNQKMYLEVKTDSAANLQGDFDKLLYAIRDLEFKSAVLIVANRNFKETKELVSNNFGPISFEEKKKLYLINAEILNDGSIDYNLFPFTSIKFN